MYISIISGSRISNIHTVMLQGRGTINCGRCKQAKYNVVIFVWMGCYQLAEFVIEERICIVIIWTLNNTKILTVLVSFRQADVSTVVQGQAYLSVSFVSLADCDCDRDLVHILYAEHVLHISHLSWTTEPLPRTWIEVEPVSVHGYSRCNGRSWAVKGNDDLLHN